MTCRRATEIDLAAFLMGGADPQLTAFRAHYPDCAACAAEVRAWTVLHERLQAGGVTPNGGHPAEALLLAFEDRPQSLRPDARQQVEHHLAECHSCRDELATLRSFDFAQLAPTAVPPPRRRRVADIGAWLRGIVWHPAFAYALLVVLGVPLIIQQLGRPPEIAVSSTPPGRGQESAEGALALRRRLEVGESAATVGGVGGAPPPAAEPHHDDLAHFDALEQPAASQARAPAALAPDSVHLQALVSAPPLLERRVIVEAPARMRASGGVGEDAQLGIVNQPADELRLDLTADGVANVRSPGGALVLRVPVPPGTQAGTNLDIRVSSADDRRELRQRRTWDGYERTLEVALPASWLVPGAYTVTVGNTDPVANRAAR